MRLGSTTASSCNHQFLQFSQLDRGSEAYYKGELQIQWSTRTRPVPKGVRPQANNAGTVKMQRVQPHGPTRADQGALFLSTFNTKKINGEKGAFLRPTQKMLFYNKVSPARMHSKPIETASKMPRSTPTRRLPYPLLINQFNAIIVFRFDVSPVLII